MNIGVGGRYILEQHIGSGNFGEVWKGRCRFSSRAVAIKISKHETVDTLVYESKIMKFLKGSEGVVPFLSCGKLADGRHYLVMEPLGETLSSLIKKGGLTESEVKNVGRALLSILESVHRKGIIHRDVKPDNFLFSIDKSRLIIADYGFCKFWMDNEGNPISESEASTPVGTWNYMSVDVHGGKTACRKDDLESMCYTLLALLLGYLPWQNIADRSRYKELIRGAKQGLAPKDIVNNARWLASMLEYVRKLSYYSIPDYRFLKDLLQDKV